MGLGRLGAGHVNDVAGDLPLAQVPEVSLPAPASSVSVGPFSSCAALVSGAAFCWGEGRLGVLGSGSNASIGDDETPAAAGPVPLPGQVQQVVQGEGHACGLMWSGTVRCWGNGTFGQLGAGHTGFVANASHSQELLFPSPVVDLSAGRFHTCALTANLSVFCWGLNDAHVVGGGGAGVLGYGMAGSVGDDEWAPSVGPIPLDAPVQAISAGAFHTCATSVSGQVYCWGANGDAGSAQPAVTAGRLGVGGTDSVGDDENITTASHVFMPFTASSVCCGWWHSCAVLVDGRSVCWGGDSSGETGGVRGRLSDSGRAGMVGDDEPVYLQGPVQLSDRAVALACGTGTTVALLRGGALQTFGKAHGGQAARPVSSPTTLGYEVEVRETGMTRADPLLPGALISSLATQAPRHAEYVRVAGQRDSACAVTVWGGVRCWGDAGTVGLGRQDLADATRTLAPKDLYSAAFLPAEAVEAGSGFEHSCALLVSGEVHCWGDGEYLGVSPRSTADASASSAVPLGAAAKRLSVGSAHSCVVLSTGAVRCWGSSTYGEALRPGYSIVQSPLPGDTVSLLGPAVDVCAGYQFTCTAQASGSVQCVGSNNYGQLGQGSTVSTSIGDSFGTINARGLSSLTRSDAVQVSCGRNHACALFANGGVQCWGQGGYNFGYYSAGKLGQPSLAIEEVFGDNELPSTLGEVELSGAAVQVSAGEGHSCTILESGAVQCFGENHGGELLNGHTRFIGDDETPASEGPGAIAHTATCISAMHSATCVTLEGGHLHCVGMNAHSNVGWGNSAPLTPSATYMGFAAPAALDLGDFISVSGISPLFRAVGSRLSWASVSQVRTCPACHMQRLQSVPPWLFDIMSSSQLVDMPTPAAATGVTCRAFGVPVLEGNGMCLPLLGCQESDFIEPSLQPFSSTCAWPLGWSLDSLLLITAVEDAAVPGSLPRVGSSGGSQIRLLGDFWPLAILTEDAAFDVFVGGEPCTQPRLASTGSILCLAPPLPLPDLSGGALLSLTHGIEGVPSPIHGPANATVQYHPPTVSVLQPSTSLPVQGSPVSIFGSNLWHTSEAVSLPATPSSLLPPSIVNVTLHSAPAAGLPIGICNITSLAEGHVQCIVPPGVGNVWLQVSVAGQGSNYAPLVYAAPQAHSLSPDQLMLGPRAALMNFSIYGSSLGVDGTQLRVTLAGVQCPAVQHVNSSFVRCLQLNTSDFQPGATNGLLQVEVGGVAARLPGALHIIGSPAISGVVPLTLPQSGGRLEVFGMSFGRSDSKTGQSIADITAVQAGFGQCVNISSTPTSLTCSMPPGIGSLSPLVVTRVDGSTATFVSQQLAYQAPVITDVQPSAVFSAFEPGSSNVSFWFAGRELPSDSLQGVDVSMSLGSVPCGSVELGNGTAMGCVNVDSHSLASSSGSVQVTLKVRGVFAAVETPPVRVYTVPSITAVLPAIVSAAGGTVLRIFGSGLGLPGGLASIQAASIGNASCALLPPTTWQYFECLTPSLVASGGGTQADLKVVLASGWAGALPQAVRFAVPEILKVQGSILLPGASGSGLTQRVAVEGVALGDPQGSGGGMWIAGTSCEAAGGSLSLGAGGRSLTCEDLNAAALPRPPAGSIQLGNVTILTNEGLTVTSEQGAVQIVGPPTVVRVTPRVVRTGEALSIEGGNFLGIDAVRIGQVEVPKHTWTVLGVGSISVSAVPPPAARTAAAMQHLSVSLTTVGGITTASSSASGTDVSYIVTPQAPTSAPQQPCGYRDGVSGTVRVAFTWMDDEVTVLSPVKAWVVEFSTDPWLDIGRNASLASRIVPVQGAAAGDVLVSSEPVEACRGQLDVPAGGHVVDVRVLDAPQVPVWLQVRAATDLVHETLRSPASRVEGPVFAKCSGAEFLATQHARRSDWSKAQCQPCPLGAVCTGGPWEWLRSEAGFSRIEWSEDGLTFEQCLDQRMCPRGAYRLVQPQDLAYLLPNSTTAQLSPASLPAAFREEFVQAAAANISANFSDTSAATADCAQGHTGPKCAKCAAGFGRLGGTMCQPCVGGTSRSLGLLFVFFLVFLLGVSWLVRGQVKTRGLSKKAHSVAKKLLVTHVQQTALMLSFDLEWPDPFSALLAASDTAAAASTQLMSLDCVRTEEVPNAVGSAFRLKVLITLLLPVCLLLVLSAGSFALASCTKTTLQEARRQVLVAALVVAFLFYTPLTRTVMQLFTCVDIGGQDRLLEDLDVLCSSAGNNGWRFGVGLPLLLLVVLGLPAGLFTLLWKRRQRLHSSDWHRRTLGLLFLGYKPEFYWYEVVIMARKALFAMVLVALRPQGLLWQVSFAMLVIMTAMIASAGWAPFTEATFNALDVASLALSMATVAGGAMLFQGAVASDPALTSGEQTPWPHHHAAGVAVTVVLTGMNVVFIGGIVVWMLKSFYATEIAPRLSLSGRKAARTDGEKGGRAVERASRPSVHVMAALAASKSHRSSLSGSAADAIAKGRFASKNPLLRSALSQRKLKDTASMKPTD